jgi:hypothetical protein
MVARVRLEPAHDIRRQCAVVRRILARCGEAWDSGDPGLAWLSRDHPGPPHHLEKRRTLVGGLGLMSDVVATIKEAGPYLVGLGGPGLRVHQCPVTWS